MNRQFSNYKNVVKITAIILPFVHTMQNSCVTNCEKSCAFSCDTLFDNLLAFSLVGSDLFIVSTGMEFFLTRYLYKKPSRESSINECHLLL